MLFYLFITFQIIYYVSCATSCYNAPIDSNSFDYIVSTDHFPTELHNSTLVNNSVNCYIFVLWQRDPDHTQIGLIAETNTQVMATKHQLQVDVGYETKFSSKPAWAKEILYQCNTDQHNSFDGFYHQQLAYYNFHVHK